MRKTIAFLITAAMATAMLFPAGCGAGGRQITKEEEEAWKNPPKEPPAEYKGNALPPPGGPPPTGN